MHGLLITDPSCHLPEGILTRYRIERLSAAGRFADGLLDDWLYRCDALLAVGSPSEVSRWQEVVAVQQSQFAPRRLTARLHRPFQLRLFSANQHYAALGIVVSEAARLLERGLNLDAIRAQLAIVGTRVEHYLALAEGSGWSRETLPFHQRWRRQTAGILHFRHGQAQPYTFSNRPLDALLETAGSLAPAQAELNLSYAGELTALLAQQAFREWHRHIVDRGGQCWLSQMDAASAQQCGPGALSLAWLSAPVRRETP